MQPAIKSANMIFMIQRKITYPTSQELKIMTQIQENIPKYGRPQDNFKIAQITIFTEKQSYHGQLTGKLIAKALEWSPQSLNTLLECLMGKREKIQMKFFPIQNISSKSQKNLPSKKNQMKNVSNLTHNFSIVCQISSGINLPLFTVEMQPSEFNNPFIHMMKKFSQVQNTFKEKEKSYKEKEEALKSQLNQIEAVEKQIIDSSSIEINLMKKQFIKHVNNEKAKIRKLMGSAPMINPFNGLIQNRTIPQKQTMQKIVENEGQSEEDNIKNRVIKKVDRQFYEKPQNQKMEVQSDIYSKKSSQNSSVYENEKKQFRKQQQMYKKNMRKFTEDHSSSSGDQSNGEKVERKKQKTYLEQQHEKMEINQGGQNNQWDELFNNN